MSITTRSYIALACAKRLSIALLSISSPGFGGGVTPATSTSKEWPSDRSVVGATKLDLCVASAASGVIGWMTRDHPRDATRHPARDETET